LILLRGVLGQWKPTTFNHHVIVVLKLSDLEKEVKEAVVEARMKAREFGPLSEEELQKNWAIEYRTIQVTQTELAVLNEKLNKLGTKRWGGYHVSEDGQGRVFYLKRRESNALRYITDLPRLGPLIIQNARQEDSKSP
jgi:hypothetical protein